MYSPLWLKAPIKVKIEVKWKNCIIGCLHKRLIQRWAGIIHSTYAAKRLKVVTFVLNNLFSCSFRKIANILPNKKKNNKLQTAKQLFGGSQRPTRPVRLKSIGLCQACFLYVNSHIVYWPSKDPFHRVFVYPASWPYLRRATQLYFSNLAFTVLTLISSGVRK